MQSPLRDIDIFWLGAVAKAIATGGTYPYVRQFPWKKQRRGSLTLLFLVDRGEESSRKLVYLSSREDLLTVWRPFVASRDPSIRFFGPSDLADLAGRRIERQVGLAKPYETTRELIAAHVHRKQVFTPVSEPSCSSPS